MNCHCPHLFTLTWPARITRHIGVALIAIGADLATPSLVALQAITSHVAITVQEAGGAKPVEKRGENEDGNGEVKKNNGHASVIISKEECLSL